MAGISLQKICPDNEINPANARPQQENLGCKISGFNFQSPEGSDVFMRSDVLYQWLK